MFATYGLLMVVINAFLLHLVALLFPERYAASSQLAALIGGAPLGSIATCWK